jgi:hypothetical protein
MLDPLFSASLRGATACFLAALVAAGCGGEPSGTIAGSATIRRLSAAQYSNVIADTFGNDIHVSGSFEPEMRDGLQAVGSSVVTFSGSGAERYYGIAHNIAAQVLDEKHRSKFVHCQPKDPKGADDACATNFFADYGRLLLRRSLRASELETFVRISSAAADSTKNFYSGLQSGLSTLLIDPYFLFIIENATPDSAKPGTGNLDAWSRASRLSFFLWNSGPDLALLDAAERGDLAKSKGLQEQVDRMLASEHLERGVRAFFTDFLDFEQFGNLQKDAATYPAFRSDAKRDAQEQALLTITNLLLTEKGDYRDLFTTRQTFMSRALGPLYRVPVEQRQGWMPYEFPPDDPRVGITSLPSFTALHAHPGRSSPTVRGKAIRELILCQKVPAPPGDVNFAIVQDTTNPDYKTSRARLTAHMTAPMCAGCHRIMDPIGLTLEQFDGAGQLRTTENGVKIDVNADIDGAKFDGSQGLGQFLHDNPAAQSCLVNSLAKYALARNLAPGETRWRDYLLKTFASDKYRFPALMRRIVTSNAFYRVSISNASEANAPQLASAN